MCNKASGILQASNVIEYLGSVTISSVEFAMEGKAKGRRREKDFAVWTFGLR